MLRHCLILTLKDYGENSLLVAVLHPKLGKLEFLARGGKNIGAKLTPLLQPLHLLHLWVAPTKGPHPTIQETKLVASYLPSRYASLKVSLKMSQLLERVTYPYLESRELMRNAVSLLLVMKRPTTPDEDIPKLWVQFELFLLAYLGVTPRIQSVRGKDVNEVGRVLEKQIDQHI